MPRRGLSFSPTELEHLLEVIEVIKPTNLSEWDLVKERHQCRFPDKNRHKETLRRKFQSMYLTRIPIGAKDSVTSATAIVSITHLLKSKTIYEEIKKKDATSTKKDPVATKIAALKSEETDEEDDDNNNDDNDDDNTKLSLSSDEEERVTDEVCTTVDPTLTKAIMATAVAAGENTTASVVANAANGKKRKNRERSFTNPISGVTVGTSKKSSSNVESSSIDKFIQFMMVQREIERQERKEEEKAKRIAEEERNNQIQTFMRMMMFQMTSMTNMMMQQQKNNMPSQEQQQCSPHPPPTNVPNSNNNTVPITLEEFNLELELNHSHHKKAAGLNRDMAPEEEKEDEIVDVTINENVNTNQEI